MNKEKDSVLISVCLITYNHAAFIRQAIEGVLMQKIDFPWEFIIADDKSTDGTTDILLEYQKKYPRLIKLLLQEKNVGPGKNWMDLISAPKGKYIAYIEGDDYWTDNYKLQKQVNFIEANPSYSICWTQYDILKNKILENLQWNDPLFQQEFTDISLENIFDINRTASLTTVFKKKCL